MAARFVTFFLLIFLSIGHGFAEDVFDKAEGVKKCAHTNDCGKNKWIRRLAAAYKCKKEGNCTDKINEAIVNNQDKMKSGVDKFGKFNECMSTKDSEEQRKCYESAKNYYRKRKADKEAATRAAEAYASSFLYERGDIAFICYKNSAWNKWMWVVGKDHAACKVRVLERANSGSYRVEMEDYCTNSTKTKGDVFWFDTGLFPSKESCEKWKFDKTAKP